MLPLLPHLICFMWKLFEPQETIPNFCFMLLPWRWESGLKSFCYMPFFIKLSPVLHDQLLLSHFTLPTLLELQCYTDVCKTHTWSSLWCFFMCFEIKKWNQTKLKNNWVISENHTLHMHIKIWPTGTHACVLPCTITAHCQYTYNSPLS